MSVDVDDIELLIRSGEYDQAVRALDERLAVEFSAPLAVTLFGVHVFRSDPENAERVLRELMPRMPFAQSLLAHLLDCVACDKVYQQRRRGEELARERAALTPLPPHALEYRTAAIHHAKGDHGGARTVLDQVHGTEPRQAGVLLFANGRKLAFSHLRDSDDLTGANLPCFHGKVLLDIPYSEIANVSLRPLQAAWDTIWVPSDIRLRRGQALFVRIPARYPGAGQHAEVAVRLGRETLWSHDTGYALADGVVDFKAFRADGGYSLFGIGRLASIRFED